MEFCQTSSIHEVIILLRRKNKRAKENGDSPKNHPNLSLSAYLNSANTNKIPKYISSKPYRSLFLDFSDYIGLNKLLLWPVLKVDEVAVTRL